MRTDLTDITIVMDRSGSMSSIRDDAEGGLNSFIEEQKQQPGDATFTLVQFDTEYEFVHKAVPISSVPRCDLRPRGNTALLDAVGRAITETGERLSATKEEDRPGLVVFVILTDGMENSSREFSRDKIKEMIEHQQTNYNWKFVFLAANQDAFATGGAMGICRGTSTNYRAEKTSAGIVLTSAKLAKARTDMSGGLAPDMNFTDGERQSLVT